MRLFENLNVDFMGKRKYFYFLSGALLLLGWIIVFIKGFQFGIDFKGGTEIVLQFEKEINISKVRDNVNKLGLGNVEVKTFGGETGVLIRTELQQVPSNIFTDIKNNIEESIDEIYPNLPHTIVDSTFNSITYKFPNPDTTNAIVDHLNSQGFQVSKISEEPTNTEMIIRIGISDWIKENLKQSFANNPFRVLREDVIGPKVGSELRRDAVIAVFLSLIGILIYLGEISFAFYMIHNLVLSYIFFLWRPEINKSLLIVLCLVISLVLSSIMYRYYEEPVRLIVRNYLNSKIPKVKKAEVNTKKAFNL